tara:strand:+ start:105 stop:569 length:465 start_codon:yes stop_codon:yes gene_type:complete
MLSHHFPRKDITDEADDSSFKFYYNLVKMQMDLQEKLEEEKKKQLALLKKQHSINSTTLDLLPAEPTPTATSEMTPKKRKAEQEKSSDAPAQKRLSTRLSSRKETIDENEEEDEGEGVTNSQPPTRIKTRTKTEDMMLTRQMIAEKIEEITENV